MYQLQKCFGINCWRTEAEYATLEEASSAFDALVSTATEGYRRLVGPNGYVWRSYQVA
jgi:hypothetical protein